MVLSKIRRNEIAWRYLIHKISKTELKNTDFNSPKIRQQIRRTAEQIDISFEEAMEFVREVLKETGQD